MSHIRIGSGGVMLMHYSPLKVAENFRVLEALHPGGGGAHVQRSRRKTHSLASFAYRARHA